MSVKATKASRDRRAILLLLGPSMLLMVTIFAIPMILFFGHSFYSYVDGQMVEDLTLSSYIKFYTDPYYYKVLFGTFKVATVVTAVALLLCCCGFIAFMYFVGGDLLLESLGLV